MHNSLLIHLDYKCSIFIIFSDNGFDLESLQCASKQDLLEIGLKMGSVIKIMNLVKKMVSPLTTLHSPNLSGSANELSVPEASGQAEELASAVQPLSSIGSDNELTLSDRRAPASPTIQSNGGSDSLQFDVHAILSEKPTGKLIIASYIDSLEKFVTCKDRQELVRICVDQLMATCSNYPTAAQKEAMAVAIVKTFPCLGYSENGTEKNYSHFYDPKGAGFIDQRLKTVRSAFAVEDRKRKNGSSPSPVKKPRKSNAIKRILPIIPEEEDHQLVEQYKYEVRKFYFLLNDC